MADLATMIGVKAITKFGGLAAAARLKEICAAVEVDFLSVDHYLGFVDPAIGPANSSHSSFVGGADFLVLEVNPVADAPKIFPSIVKTAAIDVINIVRPLTSHDHPYQAMSIKGLFVDSGSNVPMRGAMSGQLSSMLVVKERLASFFVKKLPGLRVVVEKFFQACLSQFSHVISSIDAVVRGRGAVTPCLRHYIVGA